MRSHWRRSPARRACSKGSEVPVAATGTSDPLLQARLVGERRQCERIAQGLAQRTYVLPWLAQPPVGVAALAALVGVP